MLRKADHYNWEPFLGRGRWEDGSAVGEAVLAGKTVLLTGAGGSIGSALAERIAASGARRLILLDNSEASLYQVHSDVCTVKGVAELLPIVGDAGDDALTHDLLARYRPEIVFHAAAFKHLPLMEANPFAAIVNNAMGTFALARAVARHGAAKLIMISTDKAVDPESVMGVSKRVAELALESHQNNKASMTSVRLGNVLGSRGSVVPLFLRQIRRGGPVTVTHPEVRRYFLTVREAVEFIVAAAALDSGIWVPDLGPARKILHLAEHLIRDGGLTPGTDIAISFVGLRPGDKLTERLVSARESRDETASNGLHSVTGPKLSRGDFETAMTELAAVARRRDLSALVRVLREIVPEYQPSQALLELAHTSVPS